MTLPIKLISTDFDGTIFAEFENPPIPESLVRLISELQERGAKWVINTGRDMSSLMESLARARIPIKPDYLVLVEREIFIHQGSCYTGFEEWNRDCAQAHETLFARVRADVPRLREWINGRFQATVYEDAYSPFCLIADNNGDADTIHNYLETYSREVPNLSVVRNDVYARFSHEAYNKGTSLSEIARRLDVSRSEIFAVGDHLNDLPMLTQTRARWLAAPCNAIDAVKEVVRANQGHLSEGSHGHGVASALQFCLEAASREKLIQESGNLNATYA